MPLRVSKCNSQTARGVGEFLVIVRFCIAQATVNRLCIAQAIVQLYAAQATERWRRIKGRRSSSSINFCTTAIPIIFILLNIGLSSTSVGSPYPF